MFLINLYRDALYYLPFPYDILDIRSDEEKIVLNEKKMFSIERILVSFQVTIAQLRDVFAYHIPRKKATSKNKKCKIEMADW